MQSTGRDAEVSAKHHALAMSVTLDIEDFIEAAALTRDAAKEGVGALDDLMAP